MSRCIRITCQQTMAAFSFFMTPRQLSRVLQWARTFSSPDMALPKSGEPLRFRRRCRSTNNATTAVSAASTATPPMMPPTTAPVWQMGFIQHLL